MKIPEKALNCTTHHEACPCREWRYQRMAQTLRIIRTWARMDYSSTAMRAEAMADIDRMCDEALGARLQ